jgi:hypothetical protein
MAMQALGEIRDVSLAEPLIEDIIKRLIDEPAIAASEAWKR